MAASSPRTLFWEHSANICSGFGVTAFSSMVFGDDTSEFSASEVKTSDMQNFPCYLLYEASNPRHYSDATE